MMTTRVSGALSFDRATQDLKSVSQDLQNLQRQMSGNKAHDLKTFGGGASLVVSARSALAETNARQEVANMAQARLMAQDTALTRAHDVVDMFRDRALSAAVQGNGVGLRDALNYAVGDLVGALNLEWDGQYVFGGDRNTTPVAQITADMLTTVNPFQTVGTPATLQLGDGQRVPLGESADTFAAKAFEAMKQIRLLMGPDGTGLNGQLDNAMVASIETIVGSLEEARADISAAGVRNGESKRAVDAALERLEARDIALQKTLGDRTDADLAEVAIQLSQKQSQYEAIAKVIGELRDLNLLNYLR